MGGGDRTQPDGHRCGTHHHHPSARCRPHGVHRRFRHRLFEPAVSAGLAAGRVEDRQIVRGHHRHPFGHQRRDRAHHRDGQDATATHHRRRGRAAGTARLSARPWRGSGAGLAVLARVAGHWFHRLSRTGAQRDAVKPATKKAAIGGLSMSITRCAIRLRALQCTTALPHRLGPARKGMAHDPPHHLAELARQRAGVVVLAVARTDLLHFDGDLRIAIGRQVRIEVMLDLVAQVTRQHVHQLAAGEVGRTTQLTQIPVATRFVADGFLREHFCIGGEVATEDDHERPDAAQHVGGQVAQQHGQEERAGQQRKHDVVLEHLAPHLAADRQERGAQFGRLHLAGEPTAQTQVLDRHAPFEQQREHHRDERLQQVERAPALLGEDPQQAVADVIVHAAHVGVGVVLEVMRLAPVVAGGNDVPLVGVAVELRVAHPVVLTVHDVMAQLHVLQDLGQRQQQHAGDPGRDQHAVHECAQEQQRTTGHAGPAHGGHDAADVARIGSAHLAQHARADGIEFVAERLQFGSGQGTVMDSAHEDSLQIQDQVGARRTDAQAHLCGGFVAAFTGQQMPGGAGLARAGAGIADAHAAAVFGPQALRFQPFQQRLAARQGQGTAAA
ncbi:hypothetical protein XAC2852_820046 [Xanthomonas citri pv. citri]|nr:hypothetical protein XAC2852_820046 [Xanthomonas citri pv. citri]